LKNQPHIDRQHVKQLLHQDPMTEWLLKARDWTRSHLETVVIGVLVLAAAVFGVVFFINGQTQKDQEASKLLAEAHQVFEQGSQAPADQSAAVYGQAYAKFQAVSSAYDGSAQAMDAKLGMANAQFALAKYPEAQQEYSALDSGKASDTIGALAAFGKARALEAQGKGAEALAAYNDAASRYPAGPAAAMATDAAKRLSAGGTAPALPAAKAPGAPVAPAVAPAALAVPLKN
jgi:predicted negative regulator of RcsB-dependent stress response